MNDKKITYIVNIFVFASLFISLFVMDSEDLNKIPVRFRLFLMFISMWFVGFYSRTD